LSASSDDERSALLDWLDARLGWRRAGERMSAWQIPAATGVLHTLGGVLAFVLLIQFASGALLLFHFSPAPDDAFASVRGLMREVPFGWFLRLLHAHGANWMMALIFVHLFHTAFTGAYQAPREILWMSGCALLLLLLGASLTGYILPWSQMSYWATTVVTATVGYTPLIGDDLMRWVRGGDAVGEATFHRAFAAHVALLPVAIVAFLALHVEQVRRHGLAPAQLGRTAGRVGTMPFFPYGVRRYALSIAVFLFFFLVGIFFAPNLFFPPEHFEPANPLLTPPRVRPEWYFLWAYHLPRIVPERVALLMQGVGVLALFGLPFLDDGAPRRRSWITAGLATALLALIVLGVLGALE